MSYREYEGQCGTCREFDSNGDSKGYCRHHKTFEWPSNTCNNYSDTDKYSSTGSVCFLTTVCCKYKGLSDDCYELTELRRFRNIELQKIEKGQELIKFYYDEAPRIVDQIEKSVTKVDICNWIYDKIHEVISKYHCGKMEEAVIEYLFMMYKVDLATRDEGGSLT